MKRFQKLDKFSPALFNRTHGVGGSSIQPSSLSRKGDTPGRSHQPDLETEAIAMPVVMEDERQKGRGGFTMFTKRTWDMISPA
jgi:hypothetical protein